MENIQIREYSIEDKAGCLAAFKSNIPKYFTQEEVNEFEAFLDAYHDMITTAGKPRLTHYYVVEHKGEIIGCGGFGKRDHASHITLIWGLVHRSFHKTGLGEKLLGFRLHQLRKLYPGHAVYIDTIQHTYGFFEKFGFKTLKVTNDFYAPGMHRYDMVLELEN